MISTLENSYPYICQVFLRSSGADGSLEAVQVHKPAAQTNIKSCRTSSSAKAASVKEQAKKKAEARIAPPR
jgi:phosphoribosylanthranilate isomerase